MKKFDFNPPDPQGQIHQQLSNVDRFLLAHAALKSKNPITWEFLPGKPYLCGFLNCSEDKGDELIKSGKINRYESNGEDYYLTSQVVNAINNDPSLQKLSWLSYRDKVHTPDDPIIHWIKWKFEDRILVKYLFKKETFYAILPPALWRKNTKIGNAILRIINRNLKAQSHGRK